MMSNRIDMLENEIIIIVWTRDKSGPDYDAIATVLTKELVTMLQKIR